MNSTYIEDHLIWLKRLLASAMASVLRFELMVTRQGKSKEKSDLWHVSYSARIRLRDYEDTS